MKLAVSMGLAVSIGREPFRRDEVRGVYETPGVTILQAASAQLSSITL